MTKYSEIALQNELFLNIDILWTLGPFGEVLEEVLGRFCEVLGSPKLPKIGQTRYASVNIGQNGLRRRLGGPFGAPRAAQEAPKRVPRGSQDAPRGAQKC